ncbi:MAG: hypothetical protein KFKLKKLM_01126 [Flavobacteriales bacterium]|nr:hypothetical protein [Flavobacteriales bacterium]
MRIFIFTFILFVSNCCLAQNWAENNAVWHYEQINIQPPFDEDYNKFSTIGDTLILGEPAKIILEERVTLNDTVANEIFMKSDSNRVYLFDSISNSFKLIYDFGALPGDTIEVFCPERLLDSTVTIVVDSVSTININGSILGVQHVRPLYFGGYYDMSGTIIENIGWTGFMFPLSTLADPPYGGELRCFQDDVIGFYKPSVVDCDYLETGIESINNSNNINIYPNPANDVINVSVAKELDLKNVALTLVDISGRTVLTQTIKSTETTVDINYLQKGVYLLKIGEQTTKLIKQ